MPGQRSDACENLAQLGALLSGNRETRDRARWNILVVEVVRRLDRYVPAHHPFPAVLDGVTFAEIRAAAQEEDGDRTILAAFAQWRADVRHLEVTNEKRLVVLASALELLFELKARGVEHEAVTRYDLRLRTHLVEVWGLPPPAPGERARTWAAQHAARLDLLPRTWREL